MPDFKTHYAISMIIILFVLVFFFLMRNEGNLENVTGLESVTGRISYNPENNAEKIIFNYLNYYGINGNIKGSYYKNNLWRVEVDIIESEDDVVFDVSDIGEIKCFQRYRERKCYDDFDKLNEDFLAMF